MTAVPNYNFPPKRIILKDKPVYKKGSPEHRQMKWEEYIDKEVLAVKRNIENERRGWK